MAIEDINKDNGTPGPSPETPQVPPVTPPATPPVEPPKDPQDIDFKKDLEDLDKRKPRRTPQEEAAFNLKKNADRARELGVDPAKVLGIETPEPTVPDDPAPTGSFVTKEDFAEDVARTLTAGERDPESARRVVMWHYRNSIQRTGNIHDDIENAHLLANKGRLKTAHEEIKRKATPPLGAGESAGQIPRVTANPELTREQVQVLTRRGYKQVAPGLYQARLNQYRYDPTTKTWISERIPQK